MRPRSRAGAPLWLPDELGVGPHLRLRELMVVTILGCLQLKPRDGCAQVGPAARVLHAGVSQERGT
jgi:hypothetical protein